MTSSSTTTALLADIRTVEREFGGKGNVARSGQKCTLRLAPYRVVVRGDIIQLLGHLFCGECSLDGKETQRNNCSEIRYACADIFMQETLVGDTLLIAL